MSDPREYWSELRAIALVGTGRRPILPPAPAPLTSTDAAFATAEPATALLAAAAAATLYIRAGTVPAPGAVEAVPPAPADDRPPCGPRSARQLAAVLDHRQRAVLPEWLRALATSGRRPPDATLPALLEAARADAALRPILATTIGTRGRWLAGLNPAWSFAAQAGAPAYNEAELERLWQTSARNGRVFVLEALRPERPELARTLVERTWSTEKADDRAAFVAALRPGLSEADEPFLEAALDDRGKEVRAAAAELLARLPRSRLATRMVERALALVTYKRGLLSKIEVSLPERCEKDWQRDGIEPRPPRGTGERVWWLSQVVRRTPPAAWCEAWLLAPAAIAGARVAKEWRAPLLRAWGDAALAYGDLSWAEALAEIAVREPVVLPPAELLAALPAARREPLLIRLLEHWEDAAGVEPVALSALRAAPAPWGRELAVAALRTLERRFARGNDARTDWHLRAALEEFALAIPPELAETAAATLPPWLAENPYWADTAQLFVERLRLRREMHTALRAGE